ncbi:MAG: DUF1501 domain-containing protein [Verrucomicrobiales bacterium]|nr:DUF1501 domain-containing protein [Verrucomicrobiales bacterium]
MDGFPTSPMHRRKWLGQAACGFGSLALAGMVKGAANPLASKNPPLIPRAKRVIFLFMQGGPSQVDSFEPKEALQKRSGEKLKFFYPRTGKHQDMTLYGSPWEFQNYGETGFPVSSLFPNIAKHVDDICFLHGMQTEGVAHGPSTLFLHTGATNLIRPSMGSWIMYGLGTENENLPGFISLSAPPTKGGPRNYGNAFLPADYQGTVIGRAGFPAEKATIEHLSNSMLTPEEQRKQFDFLQKLNHSQIAKNRAENDSNLDAVINSFELAYRMQSSAPDVLDISSESPETLKLYGIGEKETDNYGRQCLLARRFAESGVRYIQVNYSDNKATPMWDQHSNLPKHADHAKATDKPVAGLLADLKARGLLEDTIVWWGGEFGRTPYSQGKDGRDHNPRGFTVWMAGGGFKPGFKYGQTDEFGAEAVTGKVHMHDLHATVLHQLGLDHEQLTYRYAGRDFRLTDVYGRVVKEVLV